MIASYKKFITHTINIAKRLLQYVLFTQHLFDLIIFKNKLICLKFSDINDENSGQSRKQIYIFNSENLSTILMQLLNFNAVDK